MLQLGAVLHGAGREGEIISSPPPHSRVKAAVCQHGESKSPRPYPPQCGHYMLYMDARLNLNLDIARNFELARR